MYRRNSNRENELVQKSWDAVTAREIEPGKYLITNNYQYRHNTAPITALTITGSTILTATARPFA